MPSLVMLPFIQCHQTRGLAESGGFLKPRSRSSWARAPQARNRRAGKISLDVTQKLLKQGAARWLVARALLVISQSEMERSLARHGRAAGVLLWCQWPLAGTAAMQSDSGRVTFEVAKRTHCVVWLTFRVTEHIDYGYDASKKSLGPTRPTDSKEIDERRIHYHF
jgi:hypothetical protein